MKSRCDRSHFALSASGFTASSSSARRFSSSASRRRSASGRTRCLRAAACSASIRASVCAQRFGVEVDALGVVAQTRAPPRRPAPAADSSSSTIGAGGRRARKASAAAPPPPRAAASAAPSASVSASSEDCAPASRLEPCARRACSALTSSHSPSRRASFFSSAAFSAVSARSASRAAKLLLRFLGQPLEPFPVAEGRGESRARAPSLRRASRARSPLRAGRAAATGARAGRGCRRASSPSSFSCASVALCPLMKQRVRPARSMRAPEDHLPRVAVQLAAPPPRWQPTNPSRSQIPPRARRVRSLP